MSTAVVWTGWTPSGRKNLAVHVNPRHAERRLAAVLARSTAPRVTAVLGRSQGSVQVELSGVWGENVSCSIPEANLPAGSCLLQDQGADYCLEVAEAAPERDGAAEGDAGDAAGDAVAGANGRSATAALERQLAQLEEEELFGERCDPRRRAAFLTFGEPPAEALGEPGLAPACDPPPELAGLWAKPGVSCITRDMLDGYDRPRHADCFAWLADRPHAVRLMLYAQLIERIVEVDIYAHLRDDETLEARLPADEAAALHLHRRMVVEPASLRAVLERWGKLTWRECKQLDDRLGHSPVSVEGCDFKAADFLLTVFQICGLVEPADTRGDCPICFAEYIPHLYGVPLQNGEPLFASLQPCRHSVCMQCNDQLVPRPGEGDQLVYTCPICELELDGWQPFADSGGACQFVRSPVCRP
mmetsp:Transcript_50930/g.164966  ORF Transcript_50930/g.164966 Transcript_50930/m.164966 type:complete len:415 (-) Transcript_50930:95-1339(-)